MKYKSISVSRVATVIIIFLTSFAFSQSTNKPKISKSVFMGISKPIGETIIVLPGVHKNNQEAIINHYAMAREKIPIRFDSLQVHKGVGHPYPRLQKNNSLSGCND